MILRGLPKAVERQLTQALDHPEIAALVAEETRAARDLLAAGGAVVYRASEIEDHEITRVGEGHYELARIRLGPPPPGSWCSITSIKRITPDQVRAAIVVAIALLGYRTPTES